MNAIIFPFFMGYLTLGLRLASPSHPWKQKIDKQRLNNFQFIYILYKFPQNKAE
jgi:hypothetical protein